jgi:eukaryotic-like serine/threonine-protein kinase
VPDASFYISGLLDLHQLRQPSERRAAFRQSMAALARAVADEGPGPLEGVAPGALLRGVRAALQSGLADDLDWLAPNAAAPALYELASALPLGPERRDLGRRVLSWLLDGTAETFAALATRMARTSGKGLSSPGVRARVALLTELPFSVGVPDGPLALALTSRRELMREWIETPSTGSLPSRRLAARLLERAAREAARRASQGDPHALRAFRVEAVKRAFDHLLADRESLVWRHVAVARGLLAPWAPDLQAQLDEGLDPKFSPTEWRRAATSIAAETAVDPATALRLAAHALARGAVKRDGGVAAAFVWGAARAGEAEPEAAAELVGEAVAQAPALVAEAVLELARELGPSSLVDEATAQVVRALSRSVEDHGDEAATAIMREVLRDLDRTPRDDEPLRQQVGRALASYATGGARAAYAAGKEVLAAATGAIDALDAVSPDDEAAEGRPGLLARRTSLAVLRDVDLTLLERGVLSDLLALGSSAEAERAHEEALDALRDRLTTWILVREASASTADSGAAPSPGSQPTLRMRRLRALLHVVDGDAGETQDDGARTARLRDRLRKVALALVARYETEALSPLHRTVSAALARALDALVRTGACEPADVLLLVARVQTEAADFDTLSEASMDPDVVHVLSRYAAFLRASQPTGPEENADSLLPSVHRQAGWECSRELGAIDELAKEIVPDGAGHREVLRTVLVRIASALHAVVEAPALRALSSQGAEEPDVLLALEAALAALAQTAAGARARLEPVREGPSTPPPTGHDRTLSHAVSLILSGAGEALDEAAVAAWLLELRTRIPSGIAVAVGACVRSLVAKPLDRESFHSPIQIADTTLPPWLPARRTLGGFYVVRPVGSGAVGSVFLVHRIEDRHDPGAERFALKVPDYSATAARSLSESEFLKLFRDEASALMAVPPHSNLARFVTFDLAARPKPILVMELVEGTVLERILEAGVFDTPRALKVLDGVLAGLEAMHRAGVGHLDVKPSNVILRRGDEAVLVDFGLAGRHIRPGCTTGPYGAPEVWGALPEGVVPTPMKADVYAFGCLAFETLTGRVLFAADNEMAQIAMHLAHDGLPAPLRDLGKRGTLASLAELLFSTLRRDPRLRPSVTELRRRLAPLAASLAREAWPFAA